MNDLIIENKFKLLCQKVQQPNYVLNNYYADSLVNKLKDNDFEVQFIHETPVIEELYKAFENTINGDLTVKIFLTRVLAIVSQNENQFNHVISKYGDKLANYIKSLESTDVKLSLQVAFMEWYLAMVSHKSGATWLLNTELWKTALLSNNNKQTLFVLRQKYQFGQKFLWKLDENRDKENLSRVLGIILKPLMDLNVLEYKNLEVNLSPEEETIHNKDIEFISQLLLAIFEEHNRIFKKTDLINILINDFKITNHLSALIKLTYNEEFCLKLIYPVYWLQVAKIFLSKPLKEGHAYNYEDFFHIIIYHNNIIQNRLKKRKIITIIDFLISCTIIWKKLFTNKIFASLIEVSAIKQNIIAVLLVPLMMFAFQKFKNINNPQAEKTVELEDFYIKMFPNFNEHAVRNAYEIREYLQDMNIVPITLQCVRRLTTLKNHIDNDQANMMFQSLFFVLQEFDPCGENVSEADNEDFDVTQEKVLIMTYVMDTILLLLKHFDINWNESLVVLKLYSTVANILKRPNLTCKFVVSSLNVMSITVKKFQTYNLSLLVESTPGSQINDIGKLIYTKMHDKNWEIRDSALELLLICTDISFIKFPPFQKQIKDNNLLELAVTLVRHDTEVYVQTSALKCLALATKIPDLWRQLEVNQPDLQEDLISILRYNDEGVLRKEAANCLTELFRNTLLVPKYKMKIIKHMVSTALTDFHWETQIAALKFIKRIVYCCLSEQGMLDGNFPSVTFSKQTRKIVTLNQTEIQKRLVKALEDLSMLGCLTALTLLLDEDTEIEIMEHTHNICKEFLQILNKYNIGEVLPEDSKNMDVTLKEIKKANQLTDCEREVLDDGVAKSMDNIIEGILNSSDIHLLSDIYESTMKIEETKSVEPKLVLKDYVTPSFFVHYLKSKDFEAMINEKKQWKVGIRSMSSLLDDVLALYELDNHANTMDCY